MSGPQPLPPPLTRAQVGEAASRAGVPIASVVPLAGDASTRRFFRLVRENGGTLVAMVLDRPLDPGSDPQLVVGRYLEGIGFPIPRLEAAVHESGLLLYEDLGDLQLEDVAAGRSGASNGATVPSADRAERVAHPAHPAAAEDRLLGLYREAVGWIHLLQGRGTRELPPGHPSGACALDAEKFAFELEFFRRHYIEGLRALTLGPREDAALRRFLDALAADAAAPPRVLCHRDYHARNLLVGDGRVRVIDFQDARLGPPAYDLASLLRDSYVVLPASLRRRLIEAYRDGSEDGLSADAFQDRFDVVALQRNLKAIGTFAYQACVRGNDRYLASIAPTWAYVFDELERLPRFADARPILELAADR